MPGPPIEQLLAQTVAKFRAGQLVEARALADEALKQQPRHPDALNIAGAICTRLGDYVGVARVLQRKIEMAPRQASLRANYSMALRMLNRTTEAAAQAREAIRLDPRDATGHDCLCTALRQGDDLPGAEAAGREAVRLAPASAFMWINYASVLSARAKMAEAEAAYRQATRIAPLEPDLWSDLGAFYQRSARYDDAVAAVRRALELRFSTPWWHAAGERPPAPAPVPQTTNTLKLRHDIEQLRHLAARNRLPAGAERLVPVYERALERFIRTHGPTANAPFAPDEWSDLQGAYNRIVVWDPPARIAGGALGAFDRQAATERYAVPPGLIWVDDFLKGEALEALRRFCLEATIWNDLQHNFQEQKVARGYLGAYARVGFMAPLLFQIAEELTEALPGLLKGRRLTDMWAFKYASELEGISLHGDSAAVNVNFWITSDDANLDPDGGGLVVYPIEAPPDWDFRSINVDGDRIAKFVEESGHAPVNVPYRQNRAVIFNSDLFHATAPLRFRPGYENRRINVTMLFGDRAG